MREIFERRSIRKYLEKKVEEDLILDVIKAGMQAPSAKNQQPWSFIVVENKDVINRLKLVSPGAKAIENAPCVIVLCSENDKDKLVAEAFKHVDMGACIQNMMLMATSYHLGSLWVGIAPLEERMNLVKASLNLEKEPFALLALGYPLNPSDLKILNRFKENAIGWVK